MRKALNRSQTCSNLTCAAWHPHLDFVECYEFWQSSKDCQKLYHHYGPWIFTNHAISCANWKSTSDDKGWEKDMLFRQTPLAPQLATWPSHHFHDIHHAAVHPGAKCWQMPLDPLCSFTALFTFPLTQSSVVALPALGPLPIRSHKKPNLSPTFPSILSAPFDEKSSGENSWRFSDFKGFQSVSNVNLIQNPQILTSTSPQTAQTASSALEASENVINPNPRDSPLSRSLMSCTLISPHLRNASRTSSWKLKIVGSLDPKECCWKSRKKNTNWRLWSWKSWPKKQLSFISIPTIQDKNCHSQRPLWHQVTASGEVTPLRMSNITGTKADFNRKPIAISKIKKNTVNYRFFKTLSVIPCTPHHGCIFRPHLHKTNEKHLRFSNYPQRQSDFPMKSFSGSVTFLVRGGFLGEGLKIQRNSRKKLWWRGYRISTQNSNDLLFWFEKALFGEIDLQNRGHWGSR